MIRLAPRTAVSSLLFSALLAAAAFSPTQLRAQKVLFAEYPTTAARTPLLQWSPLPSWLTLDLALRERTEGQTSFSLVEGADRTYDLTRAWGGLEFRPTSFATGYMQFIDTHALGLPLHTVSSNMRDEFDLRQGYLDLHFKAARVPVSLISGRQELKFGSERLVGISNWTNNSRTWDGFTGKFGAANNVTLFSTSVVTVHPTSLDKHGAGLTFHGAYASLATWVPHVHLSPFVFVRAVRGVTSQQSLKGNELETTFGTELEGKLPHGFDYLANAALQRGSFSNDQIHSGQALAKLSYTAHKLPWAPRLGGEYDYATGNPHTNAYRISTFDQQYPSNHNAFGLVDLFGYENIIQKRLNLDLAPSKKLSVLLQSGTLNVASRRDNVYSGSGSTTVKAPTAGFATSDIGQEFDASARYLLPHNAVATLGLGHLFPGQLMVANSHGASLTLAYFGLDYHFKIANLTSDH